MIARAALAITVLLATASGPMPPTTGRIVWVTDGDTVRLEGGERIRIAGIDAPETQLGNAKCAAELARGHAATRQAIALLKGRTVTIVRVGRSYARTVARLSLDGRDVGAMLVAVGVAAWWPHHAPKPDWCR